MRGLISIEVLAKVEKELRSLTARPSLVLADFFDYVGGTSCGAIIAALIAIGKSMDDIRALFVASCPDMFLKARLWQRWRSKFREDALSARLRELFGDVKLGSDHLQSLLMLVLSNASTITTADGRRFTQIKTDRECTRIEPRMDTNRKLNRR